MARLFEESIICDVYPDANLDGHCSKDDTLKDFLRPGHAVAAALHVEHGLAEEGSLRGECSSASTSGSTDSRR